MRLESPPQPPPPPPPLAGCREGFYKLNIDGAIDNATGLRSIGAVVRNDSGVFMGALAMQSPHGVSVLATKLQFIYRGILFATAAGETIWAIVSNIVDDVRDLLMRFSLKEVQIRHRECNKVVRAIARFALHEEGPYCWLEEDPVWLMNCILDDLIVTNASG
ncbi:unnamed protein product [Prunus armeniaca]